MNHILKNEYYTMTISTLGAEMISLKNAEGKELIWQNPDGKYWGDHAPILFPICGAIKDAKGIYKGKEYPTKMHGFALTSEFKVADLSDTKITLTLTDSEATKAQYPFDFKFTVTYSLDADKITFGAKVENTGNDVLPYSFGWHPGFRLFTETGADIEDYAVKFDNKNEVTWVKFYGDFDRQMRDTADALAMEMLCIKFIQGAPIVGAVAGLSNAVYFQKIIGYVKLKYQKRYLLGKL